MLVKSIITGMLCLIYSGMLYADYDAASLQKLFTDKRQRAQIDAARSGDYSGTEPQQKTGKVSVSGYMTRSDGKSVVWLNKKNTLDKTRVNNIKVHQASIGKNKKVGVTVDGRHVHLKPGETWSEDSGISDVIK